MTDERRGRLIRFLSDVLVLFAFCLFVASVGNPFLKNPAEYIGCGSIQGSPNPHGCVYLPAYYWSFQVFHNATNNMVQFSSYWFGSFADLPTFRAQVPTLLIVMFLMQILTVAVGLLSLGLRKMWIRLVPLVSSAPVVLLMVSVYNELAKWFSYGLDYEIGYWLVYPSMLLFLLAFITSLVARKEKPKSSSMSHQQTELRLIQF
jgi:hypothetical protein